MQIVQKPLRLGHPVKLFSDTNNKRRDKPVIISGTTKGAVVRLENKRFPVKGENRVKAREAKTPSKVAKVADVKAIFRLVQADCHR